MVLGRDRAANGWILRRQEGPFICPLNIRDILDFCPARDQGDVHAGVRVLYVGRRLGCRIAHLRTAVADHATCLPPLFRPGGRQAPVRHSLRIQFRRFGFVLVVVGASRNGHSIAQLNLCVGVANVDKQQPTVRLQQKITVSSTDSTMPLNVMD